MGLLATVCVWMTAATSTLLHTARALSLFLFTVVVQPVMSIMKSLVVVMLCGVATADIVITGSLVSVLSSADGAHFEAGWILCRRAAVHSQDFGHVLRFSDLPLTSVLGVGPGKGNFDEQEAQKHAGKKDPASDYRTAKNGTQELVCLDGGLEERMLLRLRRAVFMLDPETQAQGAGPPRDGCPPLQQ